MTRTALIAGQGDLPGHLASALGRDGQDWFACHLAGFAPQGVGQSRAFRIEQLGSFIAGLRADGVSRVCFAGRIARPPLDPSAVDAQTMPLVPRMMQALQSGDDAALRAVLSFFAEEGIEVVAAQDIDPTLLDIPETGTPTDQDRADITRAAALHTALAPQDVGQGCVVAKGLVLAIEALPGTDHMLATLAKAPLTPPQPRDDGGFFGGDLLSGAADWLSGGEGPRTALPDFARPGGGVFFKGAKAGQDRRIDMPTIGPETIRRAAAAGLNGIALARGDVLVLDRDAVREQARARNLFLTAWDGP